MAYLTSQTKPATQALFEALSDLSLRPVQERDDFAIARLRREAEKLRSADPVGRYMALGALAALKWDEENLRRYHEASLQIAGPGLSIALWNYAISLEHISLMNEAAEKALEAHNVEREDLHILKSALNTCLQAGRLLDVQNLLKHWHMLSQDSNEFSGIESFLEVVARENLSDKDLRSVSNFLFSQLHDRNISWTTIRIEGSDQNEVIFAVSLLTSAELATDLNERLSELICNSDYIEPKVAKVVTAYYIGTLD